MTGRERILALLSRQPIDRPAWTTLVDNATLGIVPAELSADHGMAFYRHLGCDIMLLNGWNTPINFASPRLQWPADVTEHHWRDGLRSITEWRSPRGTL